MWLAINWTVDSQLIEGLKTPNLYGLLFVGGLTCGYFVVNAMFKKEGMPEKSMDQLVLYMVLSTIIGARLGHVLFYGPYWGPEGYFSNPGEIIKVWEGGLASHGAAVAILVALWYYSRKVVNKPYLWILDRIAPAIAIAGCFIRLGNLVNHEIVGDPTDAPWAFSFQFYYNEEIGNFDPTPRHPAQLYEAILYLLSFITLMYMYWKLEKWKQPGVVFGFFLIFIFGARFLVEFVKLGQTANDDSISVSTGLNTGQWLSIPLVLAGIYLLYRSKKVSHEN
ncbi:MAG: prolipoprotein diacylglyceryl transferase [Bacteroidetes bacterium]|nr:prolipoprotein diacylglyceryl transferase [Bacteroidota bacterium]